MTAYLDDDVHSVIEAMEAISCQLARQGTALKTFEKLLAIYQQRCYEAESAVGPAGQGEALGEAAGPAASASSTVAAQASLAGLGLLPGMGAVAGAMDPQQLARAADRLRATLGTRFRSHTDAQLVLSPLRLLTPVFMEDLAGVAERRPWIVLFFDVLEQTGPLLNEWVCDVLVGDEYGELPANVLAVLSGQDRLDTRCWGDHLDLVADIPLEVFTENEARQLLTARGVTSEEVIQVVLHLTGRLPVLVDTLAQNRPQGVGEVDDPSDSAVERFLKWITDPRLRDISRVCALPLQLDEDIYRTLAPASAADQYNWLRNLPFVTGSAGHARYHDVVRTPMIRLQRTQSPMRWQQQHIHIADVYQQRRQAQERALPPSSYWANAAWREHKLSETYHLLCAHPAQALPDALHEIVHTCEHGVAVVRRWAQALLQAGHDTDDPELTNWGQRLGATSVESDAGTSAKGALTQLLAAAELPVHGRALAYTLLANARRAEGQYDNALKGYEAALTLTPNLHRAHYGRGETHRLMGHYEQALAAFTRCISIEPDDSASFTSRGFTLLLMKRDEEALADYNRAIELGPNRAWPIASRGETYRIMGRYNEALADLTYAIELAPTFLWPHASRGEIYRRLGRYDEALADLTYAIELAPEDSWNFIRRGDVYRAMRRYEEALADFHSAIDLTPENFWSYCRRGDVYRSMGRYDEAIADLRYALELKPSNGWCHFRYGLVLHLLGRSEEHRHLGRAVEVFSRKAAAGGRGMVHARGNLMVVYCATHEWDKAAEELNHFLDCAPSGGRILEALNDLKDLQHVLTIAPFRIEPLCERLHAAHQQQE
ncbi:tetratricopeptide repeat protein [Streptomyces canus]|uniref:tetratricopeptide repeat protein n=1 Tax=Streptomyces canus TaxID=58343 RepID=UPI002E2D6E85|nr:tetratricopeptide repeat protein [Streptomyces canus]